jgi:hypothetical protein
MISSNLLRWVVMVLNVFWVSLGLALIFLVLRGFAILTMVPGFLLWLLLLIAVVSGVVSLFQRTYEQ